MDPKVEVSGQPSEQAHGLKTGTFQPDSEAETIPVMAEDEGMDHERQVYVIAEMYPDSAGRNCLRPHRSEHAVTAGKNRRLSCDDEV